LKDNGTPADMVQIGNEVSDGMLFPDGRRGNFDNFAALVKAGIAGAREADPAVKIVLHHHLGRSNARMREWIDNFVRRGVNFDIIGMSCYAQAQEGDWKTNFDDLAKRYPDKGLLVVEYSARKRFINDLMFNTPDQKGLGTFIWEPTRHREALFDKDGENAGGGQASNFTSDEGINQRARLPQTNSPAAANVNSNVVTHRSFGTNEAAWVEWRKLRFGGRYDVNELMDLYPQMSRGYDNDNLGQPQN
jgi:arabinogalactan endo-1,4-beta-galactosidase